MKKKIILFLVGLLAVSLYTTLVLQPSEGQEVLLRNPTSIPNYESKSAQEKQSLLWSNITETEYKNELPALSKFGAWQMALMSRQEIEHKGNLHSDFAPQDWRKYLHHRGLVAKVRVIQKGGLYTGIFKGAEFGLLRLSLTFRPKGSRDFAPGLALKVLRDGTSSANVSALVSLEGQGKDFNFFKNPLSNIVPIKSSFGFRTMHRIFGRVTSYPEELLLEDMAKVDSRGNIESSIHSPRQLFFVPADGLKTPSEEHDFRKSLAEIKSGTILYHIFAASAEKMNFDYSEYTNEDAATFRDQSEYIADIELTSDFIASSFGDEGIFFRHQVRPLEEE